MSDQVSWLLELAVKPGQLENVKTLMHEMVESTRAESGALSYEWFIGADNAVVHIYERYADSAATLVHLQGFGEKFATRFMAALTPTRWSVYGTPNAAVREAIATFRPTYLGPLGGFVR